MDFSITGGKDEDTVELSWVFIEVTLIESISVMVEFNQANQSVLHDGQFACLQIDLPKRFARRLAFESIGLMQRNIECRWKRRPIEQHLLF